MKPISELVNDRDACERIWQFFLSEDYTATLSEVELNRYEDYGVYDPADGCGTCQIDLRGYCDTFEMNLVILLTETGIVGLRAGESLEREHEYFKYNPFAFVALMNELGYGPEKSESKVAKVLAVEGGGDWADASVDYLVNISGRSGEELIDEYKASGGYSGNGRRFFRQWVIESGYCREPNDDEVEVVSESM